MSKMTAPHIPVLLKEVLAALAPKDGEIFVDGTFGAGGYTRAVLDAASCHVYAIDRDPKAVARGREMAREYDGRLIVLEGRYSEMESLLEEEGVSEVNGIALDIGLSSMQIDEPERGFSFQEDGPLDMRMSAAGESAADVVNSRSEEEIADILYQYGEERKSRRIARAIVGARKEKAITRTLELAAVVVKAIGFHRQKSGRSIHPATRTFQALRIYVNNELGELEAGLQAAENLLAPLGRLCVVTFHSLEDRISKSFLKMRSGNAPHTPRYLPLRVDDQHTPPPSFSLEKRGVTKPGEEEIRVNPRARSARLRWAVRTDAPPMPETRVMR